MIRDLAYVVTMLFVSSDLTGCARASSDSVKEPAVQVLVVGNDPRLHDLIPAALREVGIEANLCWAKDSIEALRLLPTRRIHLVVASDTPACRGPGAETLARIRAVSPTLPLVLISDEDDPDRDGAWRREVVCLERNEGPSALAAVLRKVI